MSYGAAMNDAHRLALINDPKCFVIGQGVNNPWFVGETTTGLMAEFGDRRVMDTPICEAAMTGACIGAAMAGMHPIAFHPRMDFMYLALDQIINHCASWHYMFDGRVNVPIVIRGIVNRGGEQGAQHSQSPFAVYAGIPGLKVVAPATPYDAKGLLLAALEDPNPVIYIDDRWLYDLNENVPQDYYTVPIGRAAVRRAGDDVTLIAASYMVKEALKAADRLARDGISCEVIDVRSLKPLDMETINASVARTGRAAVAIAEWGFCGVSAQIAQQVYSANYKALRCPVALVTLPDAPAPASKTLEDAYYPTCDTLCKTIGGMMTGSV